MRKSRLKMVFWLLLGLLTVACSANGSLLGQNDWSVEEQSGWVGQTGEVSWAKVVLFWDEGYMRDHEDRNPQGGGNWQAGLLWLRPRETGDWVESGPRGVIGLDKGSSMGNTLGELRLRPEPVTLGVLMISNLMTVGVRMARKYRPRLR